MASTAKTALKPHVAAWLDELDRCFVQREQLSPPCDTRGLPSPA